ncbi:MAG TPA: LemA family protein [Pyrinomonadaceae bacterium]|jgi:LemA protein|nr:LemA family protein [Pyrinomonadaceae bacterium]
MKARRVLLLAFVVFVCAASGGCGYNTLVAKQQSVKEKWSNVESQLQRRADLLPNTFEAARAASIQEQEVFGQIAEARSRLLNATSAAPQGENGDKTPEQKQAVIDAANSFGGTVGRLLSLAEAYPELRSTESFKKVQDAVEGTENRIQVAREDYNAVVRDYNTSRGQFPMVIAARMYGFKEEPYFQAEQGAREAPKLNGDTLRRNQSGQGNANAK